MKLSDLRAEFGKRNDLSKKDAEILLSLIFKEMGNSLKQGGRIEFRGFGSFFTKSYLPRKARNPQNGEDVWVGEKKRVRFRSSGQLLEKINKSLM